MLKKIEGRRRRGQQRTRWLDGITNSMDMSLSRHLGEGERQGSLACCSSWGSRVRHNWVTELYIYTYICIYIYNYEGFPGCANAKEPSTNAAAGGQETQVWSLGWKDSLEEGMATHCTILAWRILMDREPGRVSMRWQSQTLLKRFITRIYMFIEKAIY